MEVKRGCLSSSEETGLSSGFTSRQRRVRSLRAGSEKGGIGGGSVACPIYKRRPSQQQVIWPIGQNNSSAINTSTYLEDKLELVLDVVCPRPGWLGSGHLNDDTANTPHITLPPISSGGAFLGGTSTYNLPVVEHCVMDGFGQAISNSPTPPNQDALKSGHYQIRTLSCVLIISAPTVHSKCKSLR